MVKSCILLFFTICTAFGCATKFEPFTVNKPVSGDGAIVYIYRPDSLSNIMISPAIFINGKKSSEIKNGTYISVSLPTGKHVFKLELGDRYDGQHAVNLMLKDAEVYFLRIDTKLKFKKNDLYERSFDISSVASSDALMAIRNCKKTDTNRQRLRPESMASEQKLKSSENEPDTIFSNDEKSRFSISKTKNPFEK